MKKIVSIILAIVLLAAMCVTFTGCGGSKGYTVDIVQQMPHAALDSATQGFQDALIAELGEDNVEFILQNAQGETTACTTIVTDFVS